METNRTTMSKPIRQMRRPGAMFLALCVITATCHAEGSAGPAGPTKDEAGAETIFSRDYAEGVWNGWDDSAWAGVEPQYAVEAAVEARGDRALRIEVPGFVQAVLGRTSVREGRVYEIRGRIMSLGPQEFTVMIRKIGRPYRAFVIGQIDTADTWREFSISGRATATELEDAALFIKGDANSVIWIDWIEIIERPVDWERPPDPLPAPGNLLHNSGAELGLEGWYGYAGQVTDEAAHSGRRAFRISHPITSTWHPLAVGRRYRLSAWCRALEPNTRLHVAVTSWTNVRKGMGEGHSFAVGVDAWQRIAFEFTVPEPTGGTDSRAYVRLGPTRTMLVDDVMLCTAETPEAYAPRRPVEVRVRSRGVRGVHTEGQPVTLDISTAVRKPAPDLPDAVAVVIFEENADRPSRRLSVPLNTAEGTGVITIDGGLPPGHWRAETRTGLADDIVAEGETFVAVVPPMPDVPLDDWLLGGHMVNSPETLEAAWLLGIRWDRWHDMTKSSHWLYVEPTPGTFTFDDRSLDIRDAVGIRTLACFERLPPDLARKYGMNAHSAPMLLAPEDLPRWRRYVREVVTHWKGHIPAWEILNEPQHVHIRNPDGRTAGDRYRDLSTIVLEEVARIDPDATVVGLGGVNFQYKATWDSFKEAGVLGLFDVVSIHSWGTGLASCGRSPSAYMASIDWVRGMCADAGKPDVEIWDSESGYGCTSASRKYGTSAKPDPFYAAAMNAKMLVARRAARVAKWFIYNMNDVAEAGNMGCPYIFELNETVTPPAVTLAVGISLLQEAAYESMQEDPDTRLVQVHFRRPNERLTAAWCYAGEADLDVPPHARVLSMWGRPLTPANGRLTLGADPVYLLQPHPDRK